jgi:DNA-binding CsgD family transcriptional regulator
MITKESNNFVSDICQPFFEQYPVDYFDYQRYYNDGNYFCFSTHPLFIDQFIHQKLYPNQEQFDKLENTWGLMSELMPLPSGAEHHADKFKPNIQIAKSFDIYNRTYFHRKYRGFFLCCGFGSAKNSSEIFEFYMNNQNLLEGFIFYFESRIKKVIEDNERGRRVILPDYTIPGYSHILEKAENTISSLLTGKEVEVGALYLQGFSAKRIARILHIAPKTVENHIYRISTKLGTGYKQLLLQEINAIYSSLKLSNSPANLYLPS